MSWRERKEIVVLTNFLAFTVGIIFLLLSRFCFVSIFWITVFGLLGSYLTVSVIVNLFHKTFLKPSEDEVRRKELEELFDVKIDTILVNSSKYGFGGFLSKMDFEKLFDDLKAGDVLWWLDTYSPGYQLWLDNLRNAISRGAHLNMLVLSPDSPNMVHRANEIGDTYTPERFKQELNSFREALEIVRKETKRSPGRLEIVEFADLLGLPLYLVCKNDKPIYAYSSLFLGRPTAVSFPHMKWHVGDYNMLELLKSYVEKKWERNKTVSVVNMSGDVA